MPKIHQLSEIEAQKIAAGQVIERPANALKELVENAIDAQATQITLYIKDGGKALIRVVDNGWGMDRSDAQQCFKKHATSKISSIDQLSSLSSFGFRGEALASIAAVCRVTLRTKQKDMVEGTCVRADQGKLTVEPTACASVTDITIENIFDTIPARQKFLKKKETEMRQIVQTIKAIALAYPHLHITFWADDKQIFNCPGQDEIINRYPQLWDTAIADHMIAIEADNNAREISISGAISNHQLLRYDRSGIFFLVNHRWVTNHQLGRALLKGYNNVIPPGRYPIAALSITINPALIDVNCHPRKEEIIFLSPRIVEQLIYDSVRDALEKELSKKINKSVSIAQPSARYAPPSFLDQSYNQMHEKIPDVPMVAYDNNPRPSVLSDMPSPEISLPLASDVSSHDIIGQFDKTYILLNNHDGLYIVDQHAAHERILYELFEKNFKNMPTIALMFPQLVPCTEDDLSLLDGYLPLLADHGIKAELFSKDQIIIQSTPVQLKDVSLEQLIKQLIGWIKQESGVDVNQLHAYLHKKLRAQMACKAAVKAGDILTIEKMNHLLKDLDKTENRFSCPHGRPTGWLLSRAEIERKFRRRT